MRRAAGIRRATAVVAVAVVLSGCAPSEPSNRGVDAQLAYLTKHFDDRNDENFGSLSGTDCVNFTSQGLLARGWRMTDDWWHLSVLGSHQYAKAWVSSTAFKGYLDAHPELVSPIEPSEAVVGDIVQFDYEADGKPNHTATVSRVDGAAIFVVQHSPDAEFKPVQEVLDEHGGTGTMEFWSVLD